MKRLQFFLAVAALLLVLNFLQWENSNDKRANEEITPVMAQDLVLHIPSDSPTPSDGRDLFYKNFHKTALVKKKIVQRRKIKKPAPIVKAAPVIKPDDNKTLKDMAQPPMTLVGTAFRKDVRFAYLIKENERYSVGVGDKIGQNLVVQEIASDWVSIKNMQTGDVFDIQLTGGEQ